MKRSLYLFKHGRIVRKDHTLAVETEEKRHFFPVENVDDIYIFGEVELNKSLLEFLGQKQISVHFFNYHGYYVGTYYPREHNNSGYMILKQAEYYLNPVKRYQLAHLFVEGAVENMLQVLTYYQNRGKDVNAYIKAIQNLQEEGLSVLARQTGAIEGDDHISKIQELMAIEGNIRHYYYQSFNAILDQAAFNFDKRTKRPPTDPLNALISFGNSLMYVKVLSQVYRTHLDPRIGFLHTTNFRRFTLNLDVAEIFKPIIVDRLIFTLLGKSMLQSSSFERVGDAFLLNEKGRALYVQEFEKKLQTTFYHRRLKRNVSYQTLIRIELYKLEKHLMGNETYKPFVSRW